MACRSERMMPKPLQFFWILIIMIPIVLTTEVEKPRVNETSADVVDRLEARYHDESLACPEDTPSYECSGLMLRGINTNQNLSHAWAMKPKNKENGCFSMAFFRQDQPFFQFPPGNYNAGYILLPRSKIPATKFKYLVFCAFPLDAETDSRSARGCGESTEDKTGTSESCNRQKIDTVEKWEAHFQSLKDEDFRIKQCGFGMSDGNSTKNFAICLQAKRISGKFEKYAATSNEMKVQAWEDLQVCQIPFEVFFYLIGAGGGIEQAKIYREDFHKTCGFWVPIVGLCLPRPDKPCDRIFEPLVE